MTGTGVDATGQTLTATAGDLTVNGQTGDVTTGALSATNGSIDVDGAAVTVGTFTQQGAAGTVDIQGNEVALNGTVDSTAEGAIAVTAGAGGITTDAGAITGEQSVTLKATGGDITTGDGAISGAGVTLKTETSGDIALGTGEITATTGDATLTAADNITGGGTVEATLGNAVLTAGTDADVGSVTAGTNATVTAGQNATVDVLTAAQTAAGTATVTTGTDATVGTVVAGTAGTAGAVVIEAGADATVTGTVTQVRAAEDGIGNADGSDAGVKITGTNVTTQGLTDATSVYVSATERADLADIIARGNGTEQDATMVSVTGATVAVDSVSAATGQAASGVLNATQDGIVLKDAALNDLTATGNVVLAATGTPTADDGVGTVTLDGLAAGRDVTVSSANGDITGAGGIAATETATAEAVNGAVNLAGGIVGTTVKTVAGGDIDYTGDALAIGSLELTTATGHIDVGGSVISRTQDITLKTTNPDAGYIRVGGDVTANANASGTSGHVTVDSADTLEVGGSVTANGGDVTLVASDDLTVTGGITANQNGSGGGTVDVQTQKLAVPPTGEVGNIVIGGNVTADKAVYVEAHNNDASAFVEGDVTAKAAWSGAGHPADGAFVTVMGGQGAGVKGSVTADNGGVNGGVRIDAGAGEAFLGDAAGDTVTASTVTVTGEGATVGTVTASDAVTVDAKAGQATLAGDVSGTTVSVKGEGIAAQAVTATAGDLTVNGKTGNVTAGTLSATGDVDVDGAAVTVAGTTAGTDVTIDGTGQVTLTGNVNGASVAVTGTGVDAAGQALTATGGDLAVNGQTGDVTAGTLSATGNVDVDGAAVTLADVTAGTDVTIDGTGQVTLTGNVNGASVAVTGTGVDAADKALTATGGDLTVNGQTGDVTTGTLSAANGSIDVDGAAVTVAGTTAGTDVTIDGTGDVQTGALAADGAVTVKSVNGALNVAGVRGKSNAAAASATLLAKTTATVGDVTATGAVQIAGETGLTTVGTVTGGSVAVTGTGVDATGQTLTATAGDLTVNGKTGNVTTGAGAAVTIDGTGQVTLTGNVNGGSVAVTGTGVDAAGQALTATGGDLTVNGKTGNVTAGALSATGDVDVDGAAVTLADVTAGTDVTIDGTGAVEVGAVTAESAAITGSGVTVTGAATVTGALAIDAKDNLADIDAALTAGSLSVMATGALDAAGAVDVRADGYVLFGGDVSGQSVDVRAGGDIDAYSSAAGGTLYHNLTATSGNLALHSANGNVQVGALRATGGGVDVTGRNILVGDTSADASVSLAGTSDVRLLGDVSGADVTVTAGSNLVGTDRTVTATTGDITLDAGGNVTVAAAQAAQSVTVSGKTLTLETIEGTAGEVTLSATEAIAVGATTAGTSVEMTAAAGDIAVTGATTAGTGSVVMNAGGRVTTGDVITAGTAVDLDAGTAIDVNADVNAGAAILMTTAGTIDTAGTTVKSTGGLVAFDAGQTIDAGTTEAGTYVEFDAGEGITAESTAAGTYVDMLTSAGNIVTTGEVVAQDGDVTLTAENGAIETQQGVKARQNVRLIAARTVDALALEATEGFVDVDAGETVTVGTATAGSTVDLLAKTGNVVTTGEVVAQDGDVTLTAEGGSVEAGTTTASDTVRMTAQTDVTVSGTTTATAGSVALNAVTGTVTTNGELNAGATVDLDAGTAIDVNADVTGTTAVLLATAGTIDTAGTTVKSTGGLVAFDAGQTIAAGATEAGSYVEFDAGRGITAESTAAGTYVDMLTSAGDIVAGQTKADGGDVTLTAVTGSVTADATTASDNVLMTADGTVTLRGTTVAEAGDVALKAGADILTEEAAEVTAGGDVTLDADGGIAARGAILAETGDVSLRAGSGSVLTGGVAATAGDVTVRAAQDVQMNAFGPLDAATEAGGDVTLAAVGGNVVTHGRTTADGSVAMTAGSSVTVGDTVTANTPDNGAEDGIVIHAQNGDVNVNAALKALASAVRIAAENGSIRTDTDSLNAAEALIQANQAYLKAEAAIGSAAKPITTAVGLVDAQAGADVLTGTPIPAALSGIYLIQTGDRDWTIRGLRDYGTGNILAYNRAGLTIVDGQILNRDGNIVLQNDADGLTFAANRGQVTAEDGAVTVAADGGDLVLEAGTSVTASEDILARASGALTMDGTAAVRASGSESAAVLTARGDLTLGTVSAGSRVHAASEDGSILRAAETAEGAPNVIAGTVVLDAGDTIGAQGTGTEAYVTADADRLQIAAAGNAYVTANGDTLLADAGETAVDVPGALSGALTAATLPAVSEEGLAADVGGELRLNGTGSLTVDDAVSAGGNVRIEAAEDLVQHADIAALGSLTAAAGNDVLQHAAMRSDGTVLVEAGNDLLMDAAAETSAEGNVLLRAGHDLVLARVDSIADVAAEAGNDIADADADAFAFDLQGRTDALGSQTVNITAGGNVALKAGNAIGAAGERTDATDAIDVRAGGVVSAAAGGDIAVAAPEGNLVLGDTADVTVTDVAFAGTDGTAVHAAQAGTVTSGTANLAAAGAIADGNGEAVNISAERIVLTAGESVGEANPLEVTVTGAGEGVLWGNSASDGDVIMAVNTVGGNPYPNAAAMKGSRVVWLVNGTYAGGDAKYVNPMNAAHGVLFRDLPLEYDLFSVFGDYGFLYLDRDTLSRPGADYIDFARPYGAVRMTTQQAREDGSTEEEEELPLAPAYNPDAVINRISLK